MTISSIYDLKSISRTPVADPGSGTPLKKNPHPRLYKYTKFQKNPRELFFEKKLIFRLSSFEYDSYAGGWSLLRP